MRGAEVVREGSASDQGQWQSSVTPFPGYHMKGFEAVSMSLSFLTLSLFPHAWAQAMAMSLYYPYRPKG